MRPSFPTLTSLRFFAALLVLLLHTVPIFLGLRYLDLPAPLLHLIANGFTAVPFFFSLSGFVLIAVYGSEPLPASARLTFWRRRFARIAPAAYLGLLLGVPLFAKNLFAQLPSVEATTKLASYFLANLLFLQALFSDAINFNHPAWSLSSEAAFYLVFPFLLPYLAQASAQKARALLVAAIFLSFLPQLLGNLALTHSLYPWPRSLFEFNVPIFNFLGRNPLMHFGEFLFGAALARLFFLTGSGSKHGDIFLFSGMAIWLGVIASSEEIPIAALGTFLLLPAFGLVLWGAASRRSPAFGWLEHPLLLLLGNASYSLYILQDPLKDFFQLLTASWPGSLQLTVFLPAVTVISVLSYRFFEEPLRRRLSR